MRAYSIIQHLSLLCVLANRGRQRPGGQKGRDQKDRMAHIHGRARRRGQRRRRPSLINVIVCSNWGF